MRADNKPDTTADGMTVLAMPFGAFGIAVVDDRVVEMRFLPPDTRARAPDSAIGERAAMQLLRWLDDPDRPFDLPLTTRGTPFQQRVWHAIDAIPRGAVRRYGDLAADLGSAARAVGQACGANPFPIITPCHRVVAATHIGGFAGATGGYLLDAKRWLLDFEARR